MTELLAAFKLQRPAKTKILDADIDEFLSNLSPGTSAMSDDSDFEFDKAILDKWVSQCKSETPENESLEFIFDMIIKNMPSAVQYPVLQVKLFKFSRFQYFRSSMFYSCGIYIFKRFAV